MSIKRVGWKHLGTETFGMMFFAIAINVDGEKKLVTFNFFNGNIKITSNEVKPDPDNMVLASIMIIARKTVIEYISHCETK